MLTDLLSTFIGERDINNSKGKIQIEIYFEINMSILKMEVS